MKSGRYKIIELLMKRDGLGYVDALNAYEDARSEIMDAIDGTSGLDPEEVLASELGLEPDYLMDILEDYI